MKKVLYCPRPKLKRYTDGKTTKETAGKMWIYIKEEHIG